MLDTKIRRIIKNMKGGLSMSYVVEKGEKVIEGVLNGSIPIKTAETAAKVMHRISTDKNAECRMEDTFGRGVREARILEKLKGI